LATTGFARGAHATPIRVGQIGTKHAHASGKMSTMRKFSAEYEVVGVVEPDADRWKQIRQSAPYAGVPLLTEAELLMTPGLQAVAVETDVDSLLPVAERCVAAGMHIHLDKPAGVSLSHFRRICATADAKQLTIQMGYMFRSNAAFRFLFRAVRKGWLGNVFQVHCEMSKKVSDGTRRSLAQYKG
ncbi:MAG: Gfo/Idh/MocA family oxidoreductase, partial [Fuerstiella sp.]|nr:Gfo/Idh/MocA family oxidoreductase [Fuerstiella sp.]